VGPIASFEEISANLEPGLGTVDGNRWRRIYDASGRIDFGTALSLPQGKAVSVVLANWFKVDSDFDGWLLASIDGSLRVAVDGRWIYRRTTPHQRGRGIEPIPIRMGAGLHRVLCAIEKRDNRSLFSLSLRSRQNGLAPTYVAVAPGKSTSLKTQLQGLISVGLRVDTTGLPLSLSLQLAAESGAPRGSIPVSVEISNAENTDRTHWELGNWDLSRDGPDSFRAQLGPLDRLDLGEQNTLTVSVGGAQFLRTVSFPQSVQEAVRAAIEALRSLDAKEREREPFDATRATLELHLNATLDAVFKSDKATLSRQTKQLSLFSTAVAQKRNPFLSSGWVEAAIRSTYDGRPQAVLVHVPASFSTADSKPQPLVVALHGYDGSPRRIMEAFLDNAGEGPTVGGFVIAPEAHGNAFYRGAGERAVFDAIDWATATYPIDKSRISITGVSMGGTGAADIAFRDSERFSAAAPLCGYQSYFVRRDTAGKALRAWEKPLMHAFSPASLADSGHDIPLYVAHGTKDKPLENSRVLTNRYKELGYHLEQDWPDLGHAVWKKTYHDAALFGWLTKWKKNVDPAHVCFSAGLLRLGHKFWVNLTRLETQADLSRIDVAASDPTHVVVHTRAVSGFCLGLTRNLATDRDWLVTIDDTTVQAPATNSLRCFEKADGIWGSHVAQSSRGGKAPYLEGPWSDLLAAPLVVVYGTQNPQTHAINRLVATHLFEARYGVNLQIPVLADVDFELNQGGVERVVYVGRPDDHLQLARIADRLPVKVEGGRMTFGGKQFDEPDVGAVFVYPDPDRRDRLLGVVTANGPEGLLRALALPLLVPDFVVFDRGLDAAAGEPILGPAAFVRAGGFFQSDWSLPPNIEDSISSVRPR